MTITLSPRQLAPLPPSVSPIAICLGWVPALGFRRRPKKVDLRASAFTFDANHQPLFPIGSVDPLSPDGAVQHHRDWLDGRGDHTEPYLTIRLDAVSPDVNDIVIYLECYSGYDLTDVTGASCSIQAVDEARTIVEFSAAFSGRATEVMMMRLTRLDDWWGAQGLALPVIPNKAFRDGRPSTTDQIAEATAAFLGSSTSG